MSSFAKAALLSAVVFLGLTAACFFLLPKLSAPRGTSQSQVTKAEPGSKEEAEPEPEAVKTPLPPVTHDAVKITVDVVEKRTKGRLHRSRVTVFRANEGDRPGQKVWESGKSTSGAFEIPLGPGAYQVHAQCPRYKGEKRAVTVVKDTPQALVFELERGNSISGRVLAQSGAPLGNAHVVALRELGSPDADIEELLYEMINIPNMTGEVTAETWSADDGSYQLDGLDLVYYTVRAVASGYAPGKVPEVPAPREQVDIVLSRGGNIQGVVRETGGAPVAAAVVKAYPEVDSQNVFDIIMSKARPPVDKATTNPSGQFTFETLGSGVYNFLIEAKGYQPGTRMKVRVTAGDLQSLDFRLERGLTIAGIVKGPKDEPVSRARVRASLTGAAAAVRQDTVNISFDDGSVVSDEQGAFTFDTLKDGAYMILCWHDDYQTVQRKDVHPGKDELILKMSDGGRIKGRVSDAATGKPVTGARLSASDVADIHKDAVTDEYGGFLLTGLSAGTRPVSVNVTADGFARLRKEVKVLDGQETESNFELQATGSVTGLVVNSNGDGVPGARVQAKKSQETGVDQTLANDLTDREGRFTLTGIEAGENIWLRVKKNEYLDGKSEAFPVEPLENLELKPIVLQLGGALGGKVVGPDGKGVSGSMVTVMNEGDTEKTMGSNRSNSTNTQGAFKIQGLKSGKVSLLVKASHYLDKTLPDVEVIEGQLHENITIQLERGNAIAGRVVDGKGQPVASADVLVRDFTQGSKEMRVSSGPDGRFTVENIMAVDTVELEVTHESYSSYSNEKVRVGTDNLDVVLKELGTFKGVVVTSDGQPVDSFTVQPQPPNEVKDPRKRLKAQTFGASDGSFEYRGVPGGTYTVYVRSPQYAAASLPNVRIDEGEVVDLGQIEVPVGSIVTGRVVDSATGRPVSEARVQVTQGSNRFLRADTATGAPPSQSPLQITDADGYFKFSGLKSGNLSLRISRDGYVARKVDDVNPDLAEKSQDLVIELEPGGEITGIVVDTSGKLRPGMSVYLISSEGQSNQTVQTDKEGRFHFTGIPSGVFTVKAHKFGTQGAATEQAEVSVELGAGGSTDVVIELQGGN